MNHWLWTFVLPFILQRASRVLIVASGSGEGCPPTVCYRKLQAGRKAVELHVGRVLKCEDLRDCLKACDFEASFPCQGFNYRRANARQNAAGNCELTSTPYTRMSLHRDFVSDSHCDYYERDRTCHPDTDARNYPWPRVPSRVPDDYSWTAERGRFPLLTNNKPSYSYETRYGSGDRDSHDDPYFKNTGAYEYGRRRDFVSEPVGRNPTDFLYYRNEERKKVSKNGWNSYGPVYGRSYGYRTNYIGASDFPQHRADDRSDRELSRARENENFYGKFYNYGGAYGYGKNHVSTGKQPAHGGNERTGKCSVRVAAGSRLSRVLVKRTYLARNLDHCESFCSNERNFPCTSFSYRYDVLPTDPTDNCLLADVPYHQLNFYTDLEPARDYDIYAMIEDAKTCAWKKSTERYPSDECFSRVRTGFSMPPDITKQSVLVSDLGECQLACTESRQFLCRSFAFRYGYGHSSEGNRQDPGGPNCLLTDWPSRDINPANMPDMDRAELYERSSVGRGCESYSYPFFKAVTSSQDHETGVAHPDEACYSGYHRPCKLTPYAVHSSVHADSETECRRMCSRMRQTDSVPCMSFSFKIPGQGDPRDPGENCLLTDVSMRDLRPGLDYDFDENHVLYSWRELDPRCSLNTYSPDAPGSLYFKYSWQTPSFHPDHSHPEPIPPPSNPNGFHGPVYETDTRPLNGPYPPDPDPEHGIGLYYPSEFSVFRRYTVNGQPCRNGTECQRNEVAGFWSCEIQGGEHGAWDYCCEPTHRCGFSKGFHYPWCYVGPAEDQWRPCSETYQPYSPGQDRPQILNSEQWGSSRHWPVIYFHGKPPPGCNDSFTPSNYYRGHRGYRRRSGRTLRFGKV